jgi:hypothetical protein
MEVSQFDEITTGILRSFEASGKVQDQIFNADPLLALLEKKGKKEVRGGREIQVNLRYAKNDTAGSYEGYDVLDTTPQNTLAHAIFSWKQYAVSITIDNGTIAKNDDAASVIKLVSDKTQEAVDSLKDDMTTDLYGDGTGNANKDLLGLKALCATSGTLGGIDRGTYAWWRAQADTSSVAMGTPWMTTMINNIAGSGGGNTAKMGKCDLIICPQDLYESFEALILPYARERGTGVGDIGFDSLKFKGKELTWSDNMPANTVYFLSTDYLGLRVMPGIDFKFTGWKEPVNQDARVAFVKWMGNLLATNCRRLGIATNKTA